MKRLFKNLLASALVLWLSLATGFAQVNTGGTATTASHSKQVIGYITNWDAWKAAPAGLPDVGALTHLNIDYSKYTILNFSFFGVAVDGSLHSGDFRNKNIYMTNEVQQPADIFYTDIYSSWDMYILFGEIDPIQYIDQTAADRCKAQGFEVQVGGSTWSNPTWGLLNKPLPVPLHKETGAPGLLTLAHQKGVKVLASIGGWSMCKHYPAMAADPTKRKKFVDDCKKLINVGFDGIDLDWEYPGPYSGMNFTGTPADFANLTTLVQEIRNAIGTDKLITAAISADPAKIQGLEWNKLNNIMNYYNFMTYDFNGGWSNKAGHNSPLYNYDGAEATTFNWQSLLTTLNSLGVPKSKINFGAPFYGRGVITQGSAALNATTVKRSETVQPDGPITTCADYTNWPKDVYDGTPNYFFIKQKALTSGSGWTRQWDNQAKVPYLTNGSYFLSYDDVESIGYKAQFIADNQLAGTIVWTVYGDLELSGAVTSFGTKLKRWSTVKSELVNKINEVFATGGGGNSSPTISLTNPASGASFTAPANIIISANAADADGTISKVEFFNGTTSLGVKNTSPYSISWNNVGVGSYVLTAIATDDKGASTTSSRVTVAVNGTGGNNPPTVSITSPANGAIFTAPANITISGNASDSDGSISKVEFYNGATSLGTDNTSPYSISWNNVATGAYTITAMATDDKGATTMSGGVTITVSSGSDCGGLPAYPTGRGSYKGGDRVSNIGNIYECKPWPYDGWANLAADAYVPGVGFAWQDAWILIGPCGSSGNIAPTVAISSPVTGASYTAPANIIISANASDNDGSIAKVEFFNGTTSLGTDNTLPYSIAWNNVVAGSYTITTVATDDKGASTTSGSVSVTVNTAGNTPPTVSLVSPSNGATFIAPASITVSANASDNDGSISKVEFFNGTTSLGTDNTSPYSIAWNYVAAGSYTITAVATDDKGASTTSTSIVIDVTRGGSTCNGLPAYPSGIGSYKGGDRISNIGNIYECKPWPYDGWANSTNSAYEPGVGFAWQDAWIYIGLCDGDNQTAPAAPGSLSASAISSSQISISWVDNSTNESDFRIERSSDGTTWVLLTTVAANTTSFANTGLAQSTNYYYRVCAENTYGNSNFTNTANAITLSGGNNGGNLPDKLLVGYWHNFSNGSTTIKLRDVASKWNVINVAFAETAGDRCSLQFAPFNATDDEFKSDIALLNSRGQKVVLSIGGQNGVLIVSDNNARDIFISTAIALIEKYGFNGIDLDLENNVTVNSGESLDNPANPQIVNLISATRQICDHFGANFILSMAPEIAYVQGGITAYGGPWGAYLPIIHKLSDKLTYLHVQHYNCGSSTGLDGKNYNPGTADFEVAMAEMVMKGFPIAGNSSNMFPPLREDQVMIGIPATPAAAPSGGYISPAEMKKALSYLTQGVSFGGGYILQKSSGYPGFRGLMTWSINWDLTNNSEFLNNYSVYFGSAAANLTGALATDVSSVTNGNTEPVLYQNYPNPFTTTSTISYSLSKASPVLLKVLDITGKEIMTLVNAQQNAGDYSIVLNAGNLSAGIYFYKLNVGKYSKIKKMIIK